MKKYLLKKQVLLMLFSLITFNLFSQAFIEQTGIVLTGVYYSSVAWGDYDSDGYLDILLTGSTGSGNISKIYRNNGNNTFTEQTGIILNGVSEGSAVWCDYDGDGDLDILLTGLSGSGAISKIYRNNGNNTFTEQTGISLTGIYWSSVAMGDYDNDGKLDILLTGWSNTGRISKIYRNNGNNTFTEQTGISLTGIEGSSVAWGDYDNDGDLDILLTGLGSNALIYRNNGDNTFTDQTIIPSTTAEYSSAAWGDYDNDGDLDILLTGRKYNGMNSIIFRNNGNNIFTEQTGISLTGVAFGSVAWGDYNNDGALDILLTGQDVSGNKIAKIYQNNGDNTFTEQTNISLTGVDFSSVAWGDYDNDGDLDILLTGQNASGNKISKIYKNNSMKINKSPDKPINLSYEIQNTRALLKWNRITTDETPSKSITYNVKVGRQSGGNNFVSSHSASNGFRKIIALGNAQLDTIFILKNLLWDTVYYASVQALDNSYKGGIFSNEFQFKISPVQSSDLYATHVSSTSLMLKWKRGNGDRCIIFAKEGTSGTANPQNYTSYYANPVFAEGSPLGTTGWYCMYKDESDSVLLSGLDPQKNYTIHIIEFQGKNGSEIYDTNIKENIGAFSSGLFTEQSGISIKGAYFCSDAWGDYDNDGYLDFLVTGYSSTNGYISKIYHNNGDNTFTEQTSISLTGVMYSSVIWGDYDNDGDLDILLTGYTGSETISKIYRNNGNNTFTEQTGISLTGVSHSSVAWGDYDNDGDLDILLTGQDAGGNMISKIYRNNSDNTFTEQTGFSLIGVSNSSVAWGDYDNDGDLDILMTGTTSGSYTGTISRIYRNDSGIFTSINAILPGTNLGSVAWGDYDNDGDLDILLTGSGVTKIYKNNGDNTFTEQTSISLTSVYNSSAAWGDYDNDGYLDILLSGTSASSISKIFHNNGNNTFTEQTGISLTGVYWSSVAWGDYDNDGDLDIILTGQDESGNKISKIYRNNLIMKAGTINPNIKANAPTSLKSSITPGSIKLSWSPVNTDETPAKTMSFNLRYKIKNATQWRFAPHAADNGFRRLVSMGNTQLKSSFYLKNMPSGTYYWQVQAVDQGFQGGAWSVIDSLIVKNTQAFFQTDTVCQGLTTNFIDQSVATDGIATWKWDFRDGITSDLQNPVHSFGTSGIINVKLVIKSNGGVMDSLEKSIIIKPRPITEFSATTSCQGTETNIVNLTNTSGLNITSWSWDYGDGKGSTFQNPVSHGYLSAGDYQLTLIADADNGCSDTVMKTVTVGAYPVASITANTSLTFCSGDSVTLSVISNPDYSYKWMLNNTGITNANSNNFTAKLTGYYSVEVTNTKGSCKTNSLQVSLTNLDKPAIPVIVTENYQAGKCPGETRVVLNVDQPVTEYNYHWKRNGTPISDATISSYQGQGFLPAGDYTVEVNLSVCKNESVIKSITYDDAPEKPLIYSQGPTIWYLACSNDSAFKYKWYYDGTLIPGADKYLYVANQKLGKYNVSISNAKGCFTMSDTITIPKGITGIEDVDPFKGMVIYPNPSSGLFTIDMDNQLFGELKIRISDQNGKHILNIKSKKTTGHFSTQVDLSIQPKGFYFISLQINGQISNKKIIIE